MDKETQTIPNISQDHQWRDTVVGMGGMGRAGRGNTERGFIGMES